MSTQLTEDQKKQNKLNGGKQAQFVRKHCQAWMKQHQPEKLKQFEEVAEKKFPLVGEQKQEFEFDNTLLD